ncbi:MAG TPA: SH3 domain-containing protein [Acidimicrobiales bacterium]|nr:SH3 domain-containing protein [Acidimicrobiales bacterium]
MALVTALTALTASCGSSGHNGSTTTSAPTTTGSPTTTKPTTTTTTTAPVTQAHGPETVLSPIGLNVRAGPSKSAKVIGSAAQGTVLQLLGHTSQHGGWYKVQGASVTGWISANPAYSAHGPFGSYTSTAFSVLYPAGWTATGSPRSGVTFRSPSPTEKVVITTAANIAKLPPVSHGVGISQSSSRIFVACGVTGYFVTYTTSAPNRFLAGIPLLLDAHHALGLRATFTSLSQLRTLLDFVNSLSFPVAQCIGGPPTTTTVAHGKVAHGKVAHGKGPGTTSTRV